MVDLEQRVAALEATLPKMIPLGCLEMFVRDQHRFSTRPCLTCKNISSLMGRPWGCVELAKRSQQKETDDGQP